MSSSLDFFSPGAARPPLHSPTPCESTDGFARAIEHRFDSTAASLFTARLPDPPSSSTPALKISLPEASMTSISILSPSSPATFGQHNTSNTALYNFSPQLPANLDSFINDPSCLILDIRPHAAFTSARLPRALSLSVPSTLLKRPLFSLTKLSQMLPSKPSRLRFSAWSSASTILIYDAESGSISDGSNIHGLLRKFRNEGFPADKQLAWLKGGFASVWRERPDLVVSGLESEDDEDDDEGLNTLGQLARFGRSNPSTNPSVLRTKNLPISAFTSTSTTSQRPTSMGQRYSPARPQLTLPPASRHSTTPLHHAAPSPLLPDKTQSLNMPFNPFYDAVRQNVELSQGITERIPLTLPKNVCSRIKDLPFSWLRHIARRAAAAATDYNYHPSSVDSGSSYTSSDDSSAADSDQMPDTSASTNQDLIEEGAEAFAMQFYRIELSEQRRLMGILQHHTQESGHIIGSADPTSAQDESNADITKLRPNGSKMGNTPCNALFPYSITAGVEKGSKNRYRNIWPFEHARVRLHRHSSSDDDYINASFVQPLGTTKRYIATQGPLEATLSDFWNLVWEQNVHVIVMLTKEVEGMQVKCCNYWQSAQYGPLTVTLVESSETKEQETASTRNEGPSWGPSKATSDLAESAPLPPAIIRRKVILGHAGYPHTSDRSITQLQYLDWPDLNVPDDPRGILDLVWELRKEVEQISASSLSPQSQYNPLELDGSGVMNGAEIPSPVLLHCSAGVGRTGGFIAVDAILDGVRREIRNMHKHRNIQRANPSSQSPGNQNNDVTMDEVRAASKDDDYLMQVDEDDTRRQSDSPGPGSGLVMPIPGGGHEEFVVHVPVAGWSHDSMSGRHNNGHDEDVHDKGSPDSDPSFQIDIDSHRNEEQRLAQVSPWISTRKELKQWLDNGIAPGSSHWAVMIPKYSSFEQSSLDDGALASGSGSVQGISEASDRADEVYSVAQSDSKVKFIGRSSSSRSSILSSSSSSSTRSPSEAPESRIRMSNVTEFHSSSSPPSSMTAVHHPLPFDNRVRDGLDKGRNPFSSSSRSSSSMQDSTGSSFLFGSAPVESTVTSSVSSGELSKAIVDSSNSLSEEDVPSSLQHDDHTSSQTRNTPSRARSPSAVDNHSQGFDYANPRVLHLDESPSMLSTFNEPIRRIVEDMREQRMSLCQSLRQYVFVHRAIIEGALMVADEERKWRRQKASPKDIDTGGTVDGNALCTSDTAPSKKGKRNSMPMGVFSENSSKEPVLLKRHSTKRKQRSDDDSAKDDSVASGHAPCVRSQRPLNPGFFK